MSLSKTDYLELELDVEFSARKGDPGRCFGPPELCYPPEPPEMDIEKVTYNGQEITLTDEDLEKLEESIWDRLDSEDID